MKTFHSHWKKFLNLRLMEGSPGGAFAPERCLQPEPFLRELRRKGIGIYEDIAMTKPLE